MLVAFRVWFSHELLILLLLLPCTQLKGSHTCPLYDPPSPGIHCFQGDEAEKAVTGSKWAWMVEMYSNWCGHCQRFAPKLKELAREMEAWSGIIRVGVLECTESQNNQDACGTMAVQAYPTIRFFKPHDPRPLEFMKKITGTKPISDLRRMIIDHIVSITPSPKGWPNFDLLTDGSLLGEEGYSKWIPSCFIFEDDHSYLGKELLLDLSHMKSLRTRRVSDKNSAMIKHYSILEFPSAVLEAVKDHYLIITQNSVSDELPVFKEKVLHYVHHVIGDTKLHVKSQLPPRGVVKDHQKIKLQPQINRVDRWDLLNAVSYALRYEVPAHTFISGSTYSSLFDFVSLLEQVFLKVYPRLGPVARNLRDIRIKLEGNHLAGFVTNKEWHRIVNTKLNSQVFPVQPTWKVCNGSQPYLRGYPCGLWMLMHTLTLLTLPISSTNHQGPSPSSSITSMRALKIIVNFITNFFTCEVCRDHFLKLSGRGPVLGGGDGDAVLWLWEAHNIVSARLTREEGGGDPLQPKSLFPSISKCPYCYQKLAGSSHDQSHDQGVIMPDFNNTGFSAGEGVFVGGTFLRGRPFVGADIYRHFTWNRTAVILYLWNFYHLDPIHGNRTETGMQWNTGEHYHVSQSSVLRAAWPKKYRIESRESFVRQGSEVTHDDSGISLWYFVFGLVLLVIVVWLTRRHLRKYLLNSIFFNHRKLLKSMSKYFHKNNSNHLYVISL